MVKIYVKDFGVMSAELYWDAAPNSCANFVSAARQGLYEGTVFHRIIKNFMIQGGALEMVGKLLGYTIKGEFKANGVDNPIKHTRGVLSYARTMVNDSATTQFFIVHKDSPHLDGQYAAFGKLVDGFDVLDKLAGLPTNFRDMPYPLPVIEKVEVIDEPEREVEKIK